MDLITALFLTWSSKECLVLKAGREHSQVDSLGQEVTYLEVKRSGVLGLSPNDDSDPDNDREQQPGHYYRRRLSRGQMAGKLGQYQAQGCQQEGCKG